MDGHNHEENANSEDDDAHETFVKKHTNREKRDITYATIGVAMTFLFFGVPVWWHLTTVYRVTLPYSAIEDLSKEQLHIKTPVSIIIDKSVSSSIQSVHKAMEDVFSVLDDSNLLSFEISTRRANEYEANLAKSGSYIDLIESVSIPSGSFMIYLSAKSSKGSGKTMLTSKRTMLVFGDDFDDMATVFRNTVINVPQLTRFVKSLEKQSGQPDRDQMRKVKSHGSYDITFTLIDSQPNEQFPIVWDIKQAVSTHFHPLLDRLKNFAEFRVKSQVLYYTTLGVRPRPDDQGGFIVTSEDLQLSLNHIESRLASHVTTSPTVNLVVFVPGPDVTPLLLDTDLRTSAFLSPRWGGLYVANVNRTGTSPGTIGVDMAVPMSVFVSQVRQLLGLSPSQSPGQSPSLSPSQQVSVQSAEHSSLHDWEEDFLLRLHTAENLLTATQSLSSLSQLLETIDNIVINDDIGREVYSAVDDLRQSHAALRHGQLGRAFNASRRALASSEKAFFDASLLELLYFPKDQKFAIYVPLFAPVIFPIVMSLLPLAQSWREKIWPRQKLKSS